MNKKRKEFVAFRSRPRIAPIRLRLPFGRVATGAGSPGAYPGDVTDRIHVRGKTAKDRQARYVEILPALREWLALPLYPYY